MYKTLVVVFAVIAAVFAGVPAQRSERAIVYSNNLIGSPHAYSAGVPLAYSSGAVPFAYSGVYSGVPAVSAYSAYPYGANVYNGAYPSAYTYY